MMVGPSTVTLNILGEMLLLVTPELSYQQIASLIGGSDLGSGQCLGWCEELQSADLLDHEMMP